MDDDSPPLDIEKDMRVALFYFCKKRLLDQVKSIFKPKTQVEFTGLKIDVQQTVSERLAA